MIFFSLSSITDPPFILFQVDMYWYEFLLVYLVVLSADFPLHPLSHVYKFQHLIALYNSFVYINFF